MKACAECDLMEVRKEYLTVWGTRMRSFMACEIGDTWGVLELDGGGASNAVEGLSEENANLLASLLNFAANIAGCYE